MSISGKGGVGLERANIIVLFDDRKYQGCYVVLVSFLSTLHYGHNAVPLLSTDDNSNILGDDVAGLNKKKGASSGGTSS